MNPEGLSQDNAIIIKVCMHFNTIFIKVKLKSTFYLSFSNYPALSIPRCFVQFFQWRIEV